MKNNKSFSILPFLIMGVFLLFASSCEKDDDDGSTSNNPINGRSTAVFNTKITYGTMTDQEGNVYKTVTIGTQTWMAENLRTTKYNDGNTIPNVADGEKWASLTTGAYCNIDNTADNITIGTYGRLYNWHTVNTGKLAPTGWHVPSDAEWIQLVHYLGGERVSVDKLKEIGTTHWLSPNEGATNETGFTALPSASRSMNGTFRSIGDHGSLWSATEYSVESALYRYMPYDQNIIYRDWDAREAGHSVRCVKN
jgi:uncharacterized protein (TIGR02145 family)